MDTLLFFRKYKSGVKIFDSSDVTNNKQVDSNIFHIEIIEAIAPSFLQSGHRIINLNPTDIIVTQHFKNVIVKSPSFKHCLRHIGIDLHYPTPLNQFLVGDNPLIHDLMNDINPCLSYVVFQNLKEKICHSYIDLLEELVHTDIDAFVMFEAERATGLLLTELLRNHQTKISKNQSEFPSQRVKYASKYTQSGSIMSYITNQNGNVTLQQVADHFGYQKNYLSRLCHELFEVDFIHLRLSIRMNLACEQLKLTTKSIAEISEELGYHDTSTFVQKFSDVNMMSPMEYRKKYAVFTDFFRKNSSK